MSIEALNYAFNLEIVRRDCKVSAPVMKAVLIGIANHANPIGEAWPSVERISKYTALNERTVRRGIMGLLHLKLIEMEQRPGRSTIYKITWVSVSPRTDSHPGQSALPPRAVCPTNHKEPSNKSKKIAVDFRPTEENINRMLEKHPEVRLDNETDKFIDYWLARGDAKSDWQAAWRNWIRNASGYQSSRRPVATKGSSVVDRNNQRGLEFLNLLGQSERENR